MSGREPFQVDRGEHDALTSSTVQHLHGRGAFDAGTVASVGLSLIAWALGTAARDHGARDADLLRFRCVEAVRRLDASPLPEDVA